MLSGKINTLYKKKVYTNHLEKEQQPSRGSAKERSILFIEKSPKHMKKYPFSLIRAVL